MTARDAAPLPARVTGRHPLSAHLVRLTLSAPGFLSTGVADEWVALTVPGQFQTRYYTLRSVAGDAIVLDVVVHREGLVTAWAQTDCIGAEVGISSARGSFALPADAGWVVLVGDLTALPAIARITETLRGAGPAPVVTAYVEAPEGTAAAYPDAPDDVVWLDPTVEGRSRLADVVRGLAWPQGPGYFWMAGESAQMREIRRHVRHEVGLASDRYDVMGYWSGSRGRAVRAVDPGPIYARGRRAGKSDAEIWAEYDAARESR